MGCANAKKIFEKRTPQNKASSPNRSLKSWPRPKVTMTVFQLLNQFQSPEYLQSRNLALSQKSQLKQKKPLTRRVLLAPQNRLASTKYSLPNSSQLPRKANLSVSQIAT